VENMTPVERLGCNHDRCLGPKELESDIVYNEPIKCSCGRRYKYKCAVENEHKSGKMCAAFLYELPAQAQELNLY